MARYKHIDTSPRLLPVDLSRQLLPGSFEHALNHLVDHVLDLSGFDTRLSSDINSCGLRRQIKLRVSRCGEMQLG